MFKVYLWLGELVSKVKKGEIGMMDFIDFVVCSYDKEDLNGRNIGDLVDEFLDNCDRGGEDMEKIIREMVEELEILIDILKK